MIINRAKDTLFDRETLVLNAKKNRENRHCESRPTRTF